MIYYFREQISTSRSGGRRTFRICAGALFLFVAAITSAAQSTDGDLPTPVLADEIDGRIAPRDIGDARPTRYFYTFTGGPGDLLISVESANLEGNIDLFIASGLRPLSQVSLYSSGGTSLASKSVFLRRQETLLLRIEARSPNDDPGTYRIRFSGAFTPAPSVAQTTGETTNPAPRPSGRNTRRVTSVGGRIPESETESTEEKKTETSETPPPKTDTSGMPPPVSREPTPAPPTVAATPAEKSETAAPMPAETERADRTTARPDAGGGSKSKAETAESTPPPPSETAPASQPAGARLIIETKDNGLIERDMNNVRRVTIENGQIVIVLKSGEVERQSLANITRMSIVP